jgi:hypothetical membrane protein
MAQDDPNTRTAGSLLAVGATMFFLLNTVAEALYPNYSIKTNALSDLGAVGAPTQYLWNGQLFVSGVFTFVGMYFLFFKSSWPAKAGIKARKFVGCVYLMPAIGTIIVSLVPENTILAIHTLGAFITFVLGGIAASYSYRLTTGPIRFFSLALGAMTLVSTVFLGDSGTVGFGLVERLVVYPFVIWGVAFGGYLMASERAHS